MKKPVITLLSDFGESYYVGEMKGVIKTIEPQADIVDITHIINPQNILEGAFVLSRAYRHFPKGTIHVAVVDPGVGSERRAIAVDTGSYFFIGPDNGLLRWSLKGEDVERIIELDQEKIMELAKKEDISPTFHGRDIFAPAAAILCRGTDIDMLGDRLTEIEGLEVDEDSIVHIDRFGNIVTTITADIPLGTRVTIIHGNRPHEGVCVRTFQDAQRGQLIVLRGSHGLLEVDVNMGNAAKMLEADVGDIIRVENAD